MESKMTNGERHSSQFFSHLASYPVVSDGIKHYKSNTYCRKLLSIIDSTFENFAKPVLPYFQTPGSYLIPYLVKADSIADNGLDQVDSRFPIVKEDTAKIRDFALQYARYPTHIARQGRDYLVDIYVDETKKVNGDGMVKIVKTVISTQLRVSGDVLNFLSEYLKKGGVEPKVANKMKN